MPRSDSPSHCASRPDRPDGRPRPPRHSSLLPSGASPHPCLPSVSFIRPPTPPCRRARGGALHRIGHPNRHPAAAPVHRWHAGIARIGGIAGTAGTAGIGAIRSNSGIVQSSGSSRSRPLTSACAVKLPAPRNTPPIRTCAPRKSSGSGSGAGWTGSGASSGGGDAGGWTGASGRGWLHAGSAWAWNPVTHTTPGQGMRVSRPGARSMPPWSLVGHWPLRVVTGFCR